MKAAVITMARANHRRRSAVAAVAVVAVVAAVAAVAAVAGCAPGLGRGDGSVSAEVLEVMG
jgi:hypothetical protein